MEILSTSVEVLMELAAFMHEYNMQGQHTKDRALTRYSSDVSKMVENNEISTGPGRYRLGVPNAYGNAAFVPDVTVRMQKWGASHDMSSTKTDVESDLLNLGRPTTRVACGQYTPEQGAARRLTAMPEAEFPQTHGRLVDPPCTLRGSGWNRWAWLCQNPQENVMMPFEWAVDTRHAVKDTHYHAMDKPLEHSQSVRERQPFCDRVFIEPATPIARVPGPKDAPNFSDTVPGASPRPSAGAPPAAHEAPRGAAQIGVSNRLAPPQWISDNAERHRAATGVLEPPAPFTAFIAPH